MATTKEILVHGQLTQVTEFAHSAQEIDDAVDKANNAVNKAGDTMTGILSITRDGAVVCTIASDPGAVIIGSQKESGKGCSLFIPSDVSPVGWDYLAFTKAENRYAILHTGNKPSGSYTGNGSAAQRQISVGGIGQCVVVFSADGEMCLVTPAGAYYPNGNSIAFTRDIACSDGTLYVTSSTIINTNGSTYYYQVL